MVAPNARQEIQDVPLEIVGGNSFGRYSKISVSQTWNMIVNDDNSMPEPALVPYPGYKNVLPIAEGATGRGAYASSIANLLFAVWGSQFYQVDSDLQPMFRGNLTTSSGQVFMSENNGGEISITDLVHIYVYNYIDFTFKTSNVTPGFTLPVALKTPGYISFQNGRMIVSNIGTQTWYLSEFNQATMYTGASNTIGAFQSKPDTIQAALPTPGGGNNLVVIGHNVVEPWQDVGAALFPYQRSSTNNVDFGTISADTIDSLDNYIIWLSMNEESAVTLMIYQNGVGTSISTDGIDYKLANLTAPEDCVGFIYRINGHIIYQFTFITDNLSYIYDLKTKKFFTVSDENLNYHIARDVVFFNNKNYFISLNGGNLYELNNKYTNYQYSSEDIKEIPRIRVCPPLRLPSQRMFICKSLGFPIENGEVNQKTVITNEDNDPSIALATESGIDITTEGGTIIDTEFSSNVVPISYTLYSERVDLSISRDGGVTFGSSVGRYMNPIGIRKSLFNYQRLGQANDVTYQFRFSGFGRFVVFNGVVEVYQ